jgi:hypothetical protein
MDKLQKHLKKIEKLKLEKEKLKSTDPVMQKAADEWFLIALTNLSLAIGGAMAIEGLEATEDDIAKAFGFDLGKIEKALGILK